MVPKVFLMFACIIFAGTVLIPFANCQAYSSDGNGQTTTPPGGNCAKLPNTITSPYSSISATQLLSGKPWYNYAIWNSLDNTAPLPKKNAFNYYDVLGRGSEPTKNMAAEILTQEQININGASGACTNLLEVAWFTADGRQVGPYFGLSGNNLVPNAFDDSTLWSTDMSTYILFHNCDKRSPTTGICNVAFIYIHTSIKPSALTASQKATITAAVNKVLQSYCITMDSFRFFAWDDSLAQCLRLGTFPACFQAQVDMYKLLIEQ